MKLKFFTPQCGYDFNKYRDQDGKPAIHLAVIKRDIKLLQALFDIGCDFSQTDPDGQKPFNCDPSAPKDILMKAVADKKPNLSFILKILQCGVQVNSEDARGQTALFKACQGGNENKRLVKTLLEQGANIHHRDHAGNTPIVWTCKHNHLEVVKVLCKEGANVHDKNNAGTTAIINAAVLGKDNLLKFLIQKGANVNDIDDNGKTPLLVSMINRQIPVTEMLMKHGAEIQRLDHAHKVLEILKNSGCRSEYLFLVIDNFSDQFLQGDVGGELFLMVMAKCVHGFRTAYLMLQRGLSPNTTLSSGKTLLQVAIERQYTDFVQFLLQHGAKLDCAVESIFNISLYCRPKDVQEKLSIGADPNEQDAHGNTVLHKLAEQMYDESRREERREILCLLLGAGADCNIQNHHGETPLHLANSEQTYRILLDKGANINICDNQGRSLLLKFLDDANIARSSLWNSSIIKYFVTYGGDVKLRDNKGNNPLTRCINYNFESTLILLLQCGPFATDTLTQLQLQALKENKYNLVRVLLEHGGDPSWAIDEVSIHDALHNSWNRVITKHFIEAKKNEINVHDESGITPLMEACKKDYTDVVEMLLQNGALVNAADHVGETALFHCRSENSARLLLRAGAATDIKNIYGEFPCMCHSELQIMMELVEAGVSINMQDNMGETVLIHAIVKNRLSMAKFLLTNNTQKSDPNVTNYANQTALSLASCQGDISMVQLLLQNGADCNIGTSSLIEAFTKGNIDIVEYLLYQGCNPNQENTFGETLLVLAAQSGAKCKNRVLEMLKAREDLDVNVTDEHGRSLIHLAAAHKPYLLTMVPFLIKRGADITKTDAYGRTILHDWRPRKDSLSQLAFRQLMKMNIDVNYQDYNGHTALHLAVMEDDGEIRRQKCHELLNLGAHLSIPDKNGLTVYHLATHDAQLFQTLLAYAPRDFQGKELSLLHKLSGWFDTKDGILKALNIKNQENKPATSDDSNPLQNTKSINVTFHDKNSSTDLAEWIKNLADYFCTVGHHQFFKEKLSKAILCSYTEEKMAEMQEKAITVLSLFKDIASEIGKTDQMMEFTPYITGSCNEGTKVIQPDEMDMLCVMHKFDHLEYSQTNTSSPSLVKIARKFGTKNHPFCQENTEMKKHNTRHLDFLLEQPRVFRYFYFLFSKALQNKEIWKKYPKLYRIQTDDMSHNSQSITDLSLVWHGDHFPFLEFSVDVVPAFSAGGWLPDKALKHPLLKRNGFLAIPKFRVEHIKSKDLQYLFQVSFERSEADLFHIMPAELKQAYMLAKIIKSMLPKIELLPPNMFFSSYLLKTCTFKIFQDHPEYKERLEKFIASDKLSAALTQQPYDPQPLAPVEDIMHWCKQIFVRLEQAMAERNLDGFFLPGSNLIGHKIYEENYRPRLMAQICRTMLLDPNVEPQAWKYLAQAQPWKIADADEWHTLEVETEGLCKCKSYFCSKERKICK